VLGQAVADEGAGVGSSGDDRFDGDFASGCELLLGVVREKDVGSAAVRWLDGGLEFDGLGGLALHGWNYGAR